MLRRICCLWLLVSIFFLAFTSPSFASMRVKITETYRPICINEDIWEASNNQVLLYNHLNAPSTATYTTSMDWSGEGELYSGCQDPEWNASPIYLGTITLYQMGGTGSGLSLTQVSGVNFDSNYETSTEFYCAPGEITEGCDSTEEPPPEEPDDYSCQFCQLATFSPHDFPSRNISEVATVYGQKFPFDFFSGFSIQATNLECPVFTVGNRSMPLCSLKRLIDVIIIMLPMFLFGKWLFQGS